MANTMLPDDQEIEATDQCKKELREHGRVANKLNRSVRARVDSPTREGSKGGTESMVNTMLPENQEGKTMA